MKTIKFRAWDNMLCEMFEVYTLSKYEVYAIQKETEDMYKLNLSDCELIQFTGLLDKNGVEIYEGDILSCSYQDGFEGRRSVVGYSEQRMSWCLKTGSSVRPFGDNNGWASINSHYNCPLEVIGNIYENPHLLEAPHG